MTQEQHILLLALLARFAELHEDKRFALEPIFDWISRQTQEQFDLTPVGIIMEANIKIRQLEKVAHEEVSK